MKPSVRTRLLAAWMAAVPLWYGCQRPLVHSQSPDDIPDPSLQVELVGDAAIPIGRDRIEVEGVGLVVGLAGTGSDPPPSIYRAMLLDEMRKRKVDQPTQVLASPNTALVVVRGIIRTGMEKGDTFDLEVRVPSPTETRSLRGGYLLATRLTETAVVGGHVREGHLLAMAEGPVLVEPNADEENDPSALLRGRVLGGGKCLKSHGLGLLLLPDHQNVRYSALVAAAINQRFFTYNRGYKENAANPKDKEFIELRMHPRYKHNVSRYLQVVRSLPLRETPTQRVARLKRLEQQLLDPPSAARAALQLEALGHEAAPVLLRGIRSPDAEVRFYAAEALAYLDHHESHQAAAPLAQAARDEPAFRVYALTALAAMNEGDAYQELLALLSDRNVEVRYGAFRSLWAMNPNDPLVQGEHLGGKFHFVVLRTAGPPMIHVTNSFRPEIVLFGGSPTFQLPLLLDAGNQITVRGELGGPVVVSRFALHEPYQKREVTPRVDDVIRAVVDLGGTYPDVVHLLQQARQRGLLSNGCRLEVDALPQPGRRYLRSTSGSAPGSDATPAPPAEPAPALFQQGAGLDNAPQETSPPGTPQNVQPDATARPGFFRRIFGTMVPGGG